jgi:hypothetical protein
MPQLARLTTSSGGVNHHEHALGRSPGLPRFAGLAQDPSCRCRGQQAAVGGSRNPFRAHLGQIMTLPLPPSVAPYAETIWYPDLQPLLHILFLY